MKLAKMKLQTTGRVVQVSDTVCEVMYSKPVSLGRIEKRGAYWYTQDGQRCVSTRDALRHLVRLADPTAKIHKALPLKETKKTVDRKSNTVYTAVASPLVSDSFTRVGATASSRPKKAASPVNQNHPMFQVFLEFMEYMNTVPARKSQPSVGGK